MKSVFTYLRDVWTAFDEDNASLLAAGIAFYTVLSLAPMLLLVLKAVAIIYGAEAAQGTLEAQLNDFVGDEAAGLLNDAVKALDEDPGGGLAAWLSVGFLVWSGTRLFTQLQAALNQVWGVHARPEGFKQSALALLRKRAMSLGLVGALALLTLASVLVNSVVAATAAWFTNILPVPAFVLRLLDMAVSTAILGSGLLVVYRFLPDVHVKTRHVWPGALMAAGAFSLARFGIAWYLTHQSVGSAYGAAGSLVVLLFWMYVSAMILLFGAEATTITAKRMGDSPRPEAFAEKVC
ncbi:MAG: YihY/virulence factor BrkB family protein [Myxococcales bacterium]|nr:YihY/virulence factor BrkB family protein [Myxococcales bacterium]